MPRVERGPLLQGFILLLHPHLATEYPYLRRPASLRCRDRELGAQIHRKRMAFELNLVRGGKLDKLKKFYAALADLDLGRQVTMYATPA